MGRLVDIDEVIRIAKDTFPKEDVRKIAWVLCYTPKAYDVEKVVAGLEENSLNEFSPAYGGNYQIISVYDAIDTVKRGGV
jgi:hypothetical protein